MEIEKNSICGGYEVIRTLGNGYHAKYFNLIKLFFLSESS